MEFIQIIEYSTSQPEEVKKLADQFRASIGEGATDPIRVAACADRDTPGRYMTIVEFKDHDTAMANSSRPEVGAFAEQMMALCDGPPTFRNLDVIDRM